MSQQRYGSLRIIFELNSLGYKISRITVTKYMRELGWKVNWAGSLKLHQLKTQLSGSGVLDSNPTATGSSEVWISDITYIQTNKGFLYLTTVIDLYARKIVRWSLSNGMSTEETSLAAWKMPFKNRNFTEGLIFHSDREIQYARR